jgi:outer membrane lipoprotein-sorting protein
MKTRLMLVVLLLLTLLVTACQPQGAPVPQDPLEAVKTIADKQKEVKSQHIDLTMAL